MAARVLFVSSLLFFSYVLVLGQGVLLTADDFYLRGVEKLGQKDYLGAVAELTQAYELNDSDPRISRTLALAHLSAGDYENAAKFFERTLSLQPGDAESATQLAFIALSDEVQDYEKALHYAELATRLAPSSDKALYALAKAYERAGNLVQAESYYRRLRETFLESEYRDDAETELKRLNKDTFILTYRVVLKNEERFAMKSVRAFVMLGRDFGSYQKTILLSADPAFDAVMSDSLGNRFVEYKVGRVEAGEAVQLQFEYLIEVRPTIWEIVDPTTANSSGALAPYLLPEALVESNSTPISLVANALVSGITDANEKAGKIYRYVTTTLKYNLQEQSFGALHALTNPEQADCTEFASLFVALCRAAGIPARIIFGFAREPGQNYVGASHAWAEYYLDDFGWIPVDPTYGSRYATEYFARIDSDHIALCSASPLFQGKWNVIVFHSSRNPDASLLSTDSADITPAETVQPDTSLTRLLAFPEVVAELPLPKVNSATPTLFFWSAVFFFLIIVSLIMSRRLVR